MPTIKLTRTTVDKLIFSGKQECYFDSSLTGFGVRVNASSKSYFVQCRVAGRKNEKGRPLEIKQPLGKTSVVDFDDAKAKARAALNDAAKGITPGDRVEEKELNLELKLKQLKLEEKKNVTLQEVFSQYLKVKKKLKKSTADHYKLLIDTHIPDWKNLPLRSITSDMVLERHALIGQTTEAVANTTFRVFRALVNFAMDLYDDAIIKNPCRKLTSMGAWYNVAKRETFLPPREIRKWLAAVGHLGYDTSRDFLILLLFTGARKEEAATLTWGDVDLVDGTAIFRETKTGSPLYVPLAKYAVDMLKRRHRMYYDDNAADFIFQSYGKTGHITDVRNSLTVVGKETGIRIMPHDLRRSFLTYCNNVGVPVFTQKRLVNHALPKDVTEGYVQFTIESLRQEVEKVAAYILRLAGIEQGKVVQMRKTG